MSDKPELSDVSWRGIIRRRQLEELKLDVPNFIICPAYTRGFGASDDAGLLYVPGATAGYTAARRVLKKWHAKHTSPEVKWWLDVVKEKKIEPITAHELLDGVGYPRWVEYVDLFRRTKASQQSKRRAARKKVQAKEQGDGAEADVVQAPSTSSTTT